MPRLFDEDPREIFEDVPLISEKSSAFIHRLRFRRFIRHLNRPHIDKFERKDEHLEGITQGPKQYRIR